MTDARAIALDLLEAVLQRRRPLDEALAGHRDLARLDARDRAFARLLVATALRRLGQIDAAIDARLARPLPRKRAAVRDILRLGVVQLAALDTKPHAAVDTAVALARARGQAGLAGLVNAVLRRIAEAGPLPPDDPAHLNVPEWLWDSWAAAYGEETAAAIARAHLLDPPLDLTPKDPDSAARWAETLGADILPTGSLRRRGGGDPAQLPGFAEGAWWVQDAAAALPVRLVGAVAGERVADLCAAPGGKTAQLAAAGALVTAVDISEKRLSRLRDNLARLGLTATTVAADATGWPPPEPFDAVLLDAPCSATGTLRRHPDIAWTKRKDDMRRLGALQDRLLAAALRMVRPGGLVVYATCSLQPEECEQRITALLGTGAAERVPLAVDEIPGLDTAITAAGDLRTLPCHWAGSGGLDGFYAARLRRSV
ncbi:MAG: RsmB/NOP family class I SAM-dependent RNA methyltransferase [Rhodospirillales bacterium]|nr:MAG: RsmB/NOP family class I SAM-dependent RNA methyltransferase [Rhodospirillales bacterium]